MWRRAWLDLGDRRPCLDNVDIPNGQVKFCFLLNLKMGPKWPFAMVVKMQPNSHPSGQMAVWREMAIWASQMAISMATEQALIFFSL